MGIVELGLSVVIAAIGFAGGVLRERREWQKATKKNRASDV